LRFTGPSKGAEEGLIYYEIGEQKGGKYQLGNGEISFRNFASWLMSILWTVW